MLIHDGLLGSAPCGNLLGTLTHLFIYTPDTGSRIFWPHDANAAML